MSDILDWSSPSAAPAQEFFGGGIRLPYPLPASGEVPDPLPEPVTVDGDAPFPGSGPAEPANGLLAEYFDDIGLTELRALRVQPVELMAAAGQAPLRDLEPDGYAVRWSGTLQPTASGRHDFATLSDDGIRLWIGDRQLIGDWADQPLTLNTASVELTAGRSYEIRVEYFNGADEGELRLLWAPPGEAMRPVPTGVLTPAVPTAADVVLGGTRLLAQPIGDDAFRIAARPAAEGEAAEPARLRTQEIVAPGGATLRFDDDAGRLFLGKDSETRWSGSVLRIEGYGRAGVPGAEIRWDAPAEERIFGLGERFDSLDLGGRIVEQWIEDIPGQDLGRASYYTAPLVFSPDEGYGLFVQDDPEGDFSFAAREPGVNQYRRAEEAVTFVLAAGETMAELIQARTDAIGGLEGVPDWVWGPWISRNSFETQAEAIAAVQGHLDRGLPVAAVVQEAWKGRSEDGNWNNFSPERFPDLDAYFDFMEQAGVRTVLWQVPLIFPSDPAYARGVEEGWFVRGEDGEVRPRSLWLAGAANIDFTNPDATAWWLDQMRDEVRRGVSGFKTDDGEDIEPRDRFADGRRGWELHNEYAALYNQAVDTLFEEEDVEGIVWARSGSLGRERSPAQWAGDQAAEWSSLDALRTAGLSAGLSGIPYWSHDIGGYLGDPSPELYRRWTQFGAWSPLMQYHGISPREPWLFGEEALENWQLNVELRMNLVPTLIELGEEASSTGLPLMRPMFLAFPGDGSVREDYTQYMLGEDILVAPITNPGLEGREVAFPEGRWIDPVSNIAYGPGRQFVPIGQVDAPIFLREGAELRVALSSEHEQLRPFAWEPGLPVRSITVGLDPDRPQGAGPG